MTLAGEGCGEAWLPHLDLMLNLQVSLENAAPGGGSRSFFMRLYHELCPALRELLIPHLSALRWLWPAESAPKEPLKLLDRKFSTQFRLEQAPGLCVGPSGPRSPISHRAFWRKGGEITFLLQAQQLRHDARDFLQDGVMLPPLAFETANLDPHFPVVHLCRSTRGCCQNMPKTVRLVLSGSGCSPKWPGGSGSGSGRYLRTDPAGRVSHGAKDYRFPESGSIELLTAEGRSNLGDTPWDRPL